MKLSLLSLALIPVLLTGCASSGYVSDSSPGYNRGYYDHGGYNRGTSVNVTSVDRDHHNGGNYHHENAPAHHETVSNTRTTTRSTHTTAVAHHGKNTSKSSTTTSRSVESSTSRN